MLNVLRALKKASPAPPERHAHDSAELLEALREFARAGARLETCQSLAERALAVQQEQLALLRALDASRAGPLLQAQLESTLLAILASNPKYADPLRLNSYEFKVFSQFGEDGALQEIFRRVGTTNTFFVEFGVEAGLENNSAYLLFRGWSGLWIEPVREHVAAIRAGLAPLVGAGRLTVLQERVTADNVEELFAGAGVPREPDLLSIDIDGNDYHVWRRVERYRPRVVVIEYNATFPPPAEWVMPHDPGHSWDGTARFGASLESLAGLGAEKGYRLVGCALGGANAFFVRQDLVGTAFAGPFTAANHYEPPRYFLLFRRPGHPRSYEVLAAPGGRSR